jgi:hypothetical protein
MSGIDDLIASFTTKQFGLIARWQAHSVGIADRHLERRIGNGTLVIVLPGVYRLRGVQFTQELRWLSAVLAAGPDAWLSHRAGAAYHGFDIRFPKPEITIAHQRECHLDGVIDHRTRRRHDVIVVRGMPVTTKARTILDCASVLPYDVFEELLQNAVTSGLLKLEEMYAILDHRGGRGVPGVTNTRLALSGDLVDEKIQRRLELLIARIVASARVPKPERQHRFVCDDGREVFLDNAWPDRKIAVEGNGLRWHGNATQARKTAARRRSITRSGWAHYEYGWWDATDGRHEMTAELESFWAGSAPAAGVDPAQNENQAA